MFDSIQADLNTRLLISSKATTAEAQAGTNDAHYMTPAKVKTQLQYLTKTGSGSNTSATAQTTTIYDASNITSGAKRVVITGTLKNASTSYQSFLYLNGTGLDFDHSTSNTYPTISATQIAYRYGNNDTGSFKIEIDLNAKTINCAVQYQPRVTNEPASQFDVGCGYFTTLTSITASLRGSGSVASSTQYTITYIY